MFLPHREYLSGAVHGSRIKGGDGQVFIGIFTTSSGRVGPRNAINMLVVSLATVRRGLNSKWANAFSNSNDFISILRQKENDGKMMKPVELCWGASQQLLGPGSAPPRCVG